jgi:hypothetical protein
MLAVMISPDITFCCFDVIMIYDDIMNPFLVVVVVVGYHEIS